MKKSVLTTIAMACLFGLLSNTECAQAKGDSKLNSSNKSKLVAEAKTKTGLPKVLDFYTTWCGPCKKLAPVLEEIEKSYKGKVEFERYDAEAAENKALVDKYKIEGYPTVIFLDKNGKEVDKMVGFAERAGKAPIVEKIDSLLK